jgi:hypothetical protein
MPAFVVAQTCLMGDLHVGGTFAGQALGSWPLALDGGIYHREAFAWIQAGRCLHMLRPFELI